MNWRKRKKLNKLAKKHGLTHGHEYKRFIRKKVIKVRYKNRNGRRYSPEFLSAAITDFKKHRDQLIKEGKWLGEIDHPSDRLPGGENWGYPVQTHVDLAQNPDVTIESRIGVSSKGDVKFYGFDICKPCATNNEISTADYDDFQQKLHDQIQQMMDRTSVIHPPTEIPYPLPPFKPDDVTLEKLDWIVPPIPVDRNEEL